MLTVCSVCLSLLGTWPGEPWNPQQSTLLQVLVSIQSMIFCEEPWCNEPGAAAEGGSFRSVSYNEEVQRDVIRYHIQPWACRPHGIVWIEVMKRHLEANCSDMLQSLEHWMKHSGPGQYAGQVDPRPLLNALSKLVNAD